MVYFIRCKLTNLIKVGTARDPVKRLNDLQVGSPGELEIIALFEGDYHVESKYHEQLQAHRVRGEWFDIPDDVIDSIKEHGVWSFRSKLRPAQTPRDRAVALAMSEGLKEWTSSEDVYRSLRAAADTAVDEFRFELQVTHE